MSVLIAPGSVLATYREPFGLSPLWRTMPEGLTLAEMAAAMPLPHDFAMRGTICVNGRPVTRAAWPHLRPKARTPAGVPVEVTFHLPPLGGGNRDGGGNGGKQVLALVASIALTVVTGAIAGGAAARFLGAGFGAGTLGATALAAGVSLAGSLVIAGLSAPPVPRKPRRERPAEGAAAATGNLLEPNAAIPRVLGDRRVFPPLLAEPLIDFSGPDEIAEAVYGLAGPHRLSAVRVGAAPAETVTGLEVETREGWPGEQPLTLIRRFGRTEALQAELAGHRTDQTAGDRLDVYSEIAAALPQPQIVATRSAPDEHWLHLLLPQGLNDRGTDTRLRMPFRLRMRPRGTATWRNLPELHIEGATNRQMRLAIRLIWTTSPTEAAAASSEGFVGARLTSPPQTVEPAGGGWTADPYFDGASGDPWLDASNLGATAVRYVSLSRYEARIHLDPASWPPGVWEIEIVRGATFLATDWSPSAGTVAGSVWALFGYRDPAAPRIVRSRDGVSDTVVLLRSVSVRNAVPVSGGDLALVAVRVRNRALDAVSVQAGGWVPDWDGTAWRDWQVTRNPAPHLRDVYAGRFNPRPVPAELIDDAELIAWRTACDTATWEIDHVSEDESVLDAAKIVASAGYARPRMADVWGVVRDRDRSAEGPVQLFTPRNSRGLRWSRGLADMPDGFRVTFWDRADEWKPRQIDIPRPGGSLPLALPEQVTYEGLTSEDQVRARAAYDLSQAERRATFWSLEAPAEAIVVRQGDLVGVVHDSLSVQHAAARVVHRRFDGAGDVVGVELDGAVPVWNEGDLLAVTDLLAVPDLLALGRRTGAVVRGPAGPGAAIEITDATATTTSLTFAVPQAAADVPEGALVVVGPVGREVLRLIVAEVTPGPELTATLTLVDEAPGLLPAT